MPRGANRDRPVIEMPTAGTVRSYLDRVVRVRHAPDNGEEEVTVGRVAVVNEGVVVLNVRQDGGFVSRGIFLEHIVSIQEQPRKAIKS